MSLLIRAYSICRETDAAGYTTWEIIYAGKKQGGSHDKALGDSLH